MLKKIKLIAVFGIFILSFASHFMVDLYPNILVSFFFPVNESIWEHMKIIYSSTLIYGIFDYLLLRYNKVSFNNFSWQLFITSFSEIIIFLLIYLPIYKLVGEALPVTLLLMILVYGIGQAISYYILKHKDIHYLNFISFFLIVFVYVIFIILTYNPPHKEIFYDTNGGYYGIKRLTIHNE